MSFVDYSQADLPVLDQPEAVVIGGGFGGVSAALALARHGRRVTLVEHRTYLGQEVTARLRPWLPHRPAEALPSLLQSCLEASGEEGRGAETPLQLDALKLHLEELLLQAGVKLLYASFAAGVEQRDGSLVGVILGNKSGRQLLPCRLLIDTTETAVTARLLGQAFEPTMQSRDSTRTLEFDGVDRALEAELYQGELRTDSGRRLVCHPGARSGLVWVECSLDLPETGNDAFGLAEREAAARMESMQAVREIKAELPAFQTSYLSGAAQEVYGVVTPRRVSLETPDWAQWLPGHRLTDHLGRQAPVARFAGPVAGLWHLNESVPLEGVDPLEFSDPRFSSQMGAALGEYLHRHWQSATANSPTQARVELPRNSPETSPAGPTEGAALQIRDPHSPQRGYPYPRRRVAAGEVPVVREVDVLVVGGGTSGATAAITAAREGMQTLLVELNLGLGGTGTYGGVHSYWFGRRIGYSQTVVRWVEEAHRFIHHKEPRGSLGRWNIEAKAYALLKEAQAAGVELLLNACVTGAIVEGETVRGVVAATRCGPVAVLGRVVIDASGDGDTAAFAGASFHYGSPREHAVMWYSLAQFASPGLTQNNFTSTVDVSNIEDYTRAILAGRRRAGKNGVYDHGTYLATRESRHILGDRVLTLTDQLLQRRWPDVIQISFSNHDIKGHSSSDWIRIGLIPPNLEIEIPYAALLPRGLENILVVGKAFSATHDALPAIRMQADLENLGGAAALAAAQAVREGVAPRHIEVRRLQERLVSEGSLPAQVLERRLVPRSYTEADLRRLLAEIPLDKPLYSYSDMDLDEVFQGSLPLVELCCAGPAAVPVLEAALPQASGEAQLTLAKAAALTGSKAGVPVLVSALMEYLQGEELPPREAHIQNTQLPPDQGAMPEPAYLLYALGMTPDRRSLPVWQRVAERLSKAQKADFYDDHQGTFYYVDALCFGIERLADPELVLVLEQFRRSPALSGKAVTQGLPVDYVQERMAYLEVVIGRTLARCGSPDGLVILLGYLNDRRALLAEHAHTELASITGVDLGKDRAAWAEWIEAHGDRLSPAPWSELTEAQAAWGEEILI